MTTVPVSRGRPPGHAAPVDARAILLVCGIYAALLYTAMLVFVPMSWNGYSSASQTVSELSAIGAPTRPLWVTLGLVYTLLVAAFGWGVARSAGGSRHLRVAGGLIVASGAIGLFWPPMHPRGAEPTLTDTLHIAFALAWNVLAVAAVVLAAAALGGRFRLYSGATLAAFLVFGTLTGLDGPRVAANLPTPWVGVWERVLIGAWLLWTVVLAVALLRRPVDAPAEPAPEDGVVRRAVRTTAVRILLMGGALAAGLAAGPAALAAQEHGQAQTRMQVPASMRAGHAKIHAALESATRASGRAGEAARAGAGAPPPLGARGAARPAAPGPAAPPGGGADGAVDAGRHGGLAARRAAADAAGARPAR